jgi:hypothetical protein
MKGNLFVESNDSTVDVYVDGLRLGPLGTGLFRDIPAGDRIVDQRASLTVPGNETARIKLSVVGIGAFAADAPPDVRISLSGNGPSRDLNGGSTLADLPEGTYRVSASGSGYQTTASSVTVRKGQTVSWTPYQVGWVNFIVSPTMATFSIDGRDYGRVPKEMALPPESYTLKFMAPGFKESQLTLNVSLG